LKEQIINLFKLNRDRILQDRKIPKNTFYDLDAFNTSKKRIFTEDINEINLLAILNEDTINISAYKDEELNYSEVDIIYVDMKNTNNIQVIIEAIQKNILNPVILVFSYESSILIQVALKRLNQSEKDKQVIEEDYSTDWINILSASEPKAKFLASLDISKFSFDNLYSFYLEFSRLVYQSIFISVLGDFEFYRKLDTIILKPQIESYLNNLKLIARLEAEQSQTLEFGVRVSLQQKLLDAQKQQSLIRERLQNFLRDKTYA
jgi:hypothetical protein